MIWAITFLSIALVAIIVSKILVYVVNRAGKNLCEDCPTCDHMESLYMITYQYPTEVGKAIFKRLDGMPDDPLAPDTSKCPMPRERRVCRHSEERLKRVASEIIEEMKPTPLKAKAPDAHVVDMEEERRRRDKSGKRA
jgi:hypothetical protein